MLTGARFRRWTLKWAISAGQAKVHKSGKRPMLPPTLVDNSNHGGLTIESVSVAFRQFERVCDERERQWS